MILACPARSDGMIGHARGFRPCTGLPEPVTACFPLLLVDGESVRQTAQKLARHPSRRKPFQMTHERIYDLLDFP
jgi:hypothetical protein